MANLEKDQLKGVILDMDGVLWKESQPLVDLPGVFQRLEELNLRVIALTNNSTRTPESYLKRLRGLGVKLERWQVINSSEAAAEYLSERFPQGGPLFIVGEQGLHLALQERGFFHLEATPADGDRILAVVAGMDRDLTYQKIDRAGVWIRAGKDFIGTNPDKTYPTPEGLSPGAGVVLAAIEAASGQRPQIMGKPRPEIYQIALERLECEPHQVVMIGDRLETDILGAQQMGIPTGLVLTGVTTREMIGSHTPAPDIIAEDVAQLIQKLG